MNSMIAVFRSFFSRMLGYFKRERDTGQGPTVLGMETSEHKKIPKAEEINKAVNEVKEMYHRYSLEK